MTYPTFRDVEMLSAYLDGKLSQVDSTRLEARLSADPELRSVLQDLSGARSLLRSLPQRRAPRNFTLSPQKARVRPPLPRAYPVLRFASALAAILFFFTFLGNNIVLPAAQTAAPALGQDRFASGGGGGGEATEPPQESAPLAGAIPAPTATPELGAALVAPTPTPEMSAALVAPEPSPVPTSEQAKAASPASFQPWQGALLALALVLGGSALFVRWRADRSFKKKTRTQQ